MIPILLIQSTKSELLDLSTSSRFIPITATLVQLIDGFYYYDLSKITTAKWKWASQLDITKNPITIEGWVKLSSINPDITTDIFGGHANGSWYQGVRVSVGGSRMVLSVGDGSLDYGVYEGMPMGVPTHFAWVITQDRKVLYVNGTSVLSEPLLNGMSIPDAMTFGYTNKDNEDKSTASDTMVNQLIVWNGARYTGDFTPEHITYEQQKHLVLDGSEFLRFYGLTKTSTITDKVLVKGAPVERKVCLYLRSSNELVATTWSDSAGNYRFDGLLINTEYYVLALDHTRQYNAVIQDMIRVTQ